MGYLYIFGTIFFTVFGQIILKWRINHLNWSTSQYSIPNVFTTFVKILIDPFVLLGFGSAFIASIFWILAMTKFELTYAYPFMSIAPALVFVFGIFFLQEEFTIGKVLGLIFIVFGVIITVKL